jgi:site-specific recombinase XerD
MLRHTFITILALGGVHPKKAQQLARHSSIELTMQFYTHLDTHDLAPALELVPDLPEPRIQAENVG